MTLNQKLLNYPTPIIAISKDGLVVAKNYMTDISLPAVRVGAIASKYTPINFNAEKLSRSTFCGKDCTYFTIFDNIENEEVTLLFVTFSAFGTDLLPFELLKEYKSKIDSEKTAEENKNRERKYVRSIHNNLIKADYFETFSKVFDKNLEIKNYEVDKNQISLSEVLFAVRGISNIYLEDIEINFITEPGTDITVSCIGQNGIANLIINSLSFCVINAKQGIEVELATEDNEAYLSFCFSSNSLFDQWLSPENNSVLNSSLALFVAFEIAKRNGIKCILKREKCDSETKYYLRYAMPAQKSNVIKFSSSDEFLEIAKKRFLHIFFGDKL